MGYGISDLATTSKPELAVASNRRRRRAAGTSAVVAIALLISLLVIQSRSVADQELVSTPLVSVPMTGASIIDADTEPVSVAEAAPPPVPALISRAGVESAPAEVDVSAPVAASISGAGEPVARTIADPVTAVGRDREEVPAEERENDVPPPATAAVQVVKAESTAIKEAEEADVAEQPVTVEQPNDEVAPVEVDPPADRSTCAVPTADCYPCHDEAGFCLRVDRLACAAPTPDCNPCLVENRYCLLTCDTSPPTPGTEYAQYCELCWSVGGADPECRAFLRNDPKT